MREYVYYAVTPFTTALIPDDGITYLDLFSEPYYEVEIDCMCYGVVLYNRQLDPVEIAGSGLVSEPID